jgi:hypothetical protein
MVHTYTHKQNYGNEEGALHAPTRPFTHTMPRTPYTPLHSPMVHEVLQVGTRYSNEHVDVSGGNLASQRHTQACHCGPLSIVSVALP